MRKSWRKGFIGIATAALLASVGGYAWSQGQTVVTTLVGTELFTIRASSGPLALGITANNLSAWVQNGGGSAGTNGQFYVGVTSGSPKFVTMSQDCTTTNAGVVTCTKTNNTAFTSASTTAIGTSGATIPLLNGANVWSGATNTFSGQIITTAGLPTIASGACGTTTNGAVVAGSTNQAGSITIGAAATTTCTISWSATLASAPKACVFMAMNAAAIAATTLPFVSAPSTAGVVFNGAVLASTNWSYICI